MEHAIQQDYFIPDLSKKIKKFTDNCVVCILATKKKGKQEGWLHAIDKYDTPLHTYHIDHVSPMASTAKSYQHILVVIDAFTQFTWLYPTKNTECEEAIGKLEGQKDIFGNPHRIIADKASAFTNILSCV